jgi:hypothetical protein
MSGRLGAHNIPELMPSNAETASNNEKLSTIAMRENSIENSNEAVMTILFLPILSDSLPKNGWDSTLGMLIAVKNTPIIEAVALKSSLRYKG